MLKYRVITALILIPIVIAALFLLPPAGFGLVIIAISGLAGWEWAQFVGWHSQGKRVATGLGFAALLLIMQFSLPSFDNLINTPMIKNGLWAGLLWWIAAVLLVVSYPNSANMWKNSAFIKLLFGILTIVPFYCGMMALRVFDYNTDHYIGAWWLLYVMLLVWAADSGAYAFGRLIGKHKMAPKVSPGKTLEGLVGGLITAGLASWLFTRFAPVNEIPNNLLLISGVVVIVSVFGDLAESMFKRVSGIKDSSQLIPGHGGVLDRIDSLTAAIPVFAGLVFLISSGFGL